MPDQKVKISCKGNKLSVSMLNVKLKRFRDQVRWTCKGGSLQIQFKAAGNPFPGPVPPTGDGVELPSGIPTVNGVYGYSMIIKPTKSGMPTITLDPQVDIDDVGPPKPPKKQAAAKKAAKKTGNKKSAKKRARR